MIEAPPPEFPAPVRRRRIGLRIAVSLVLIAVLGVGTAAGYVAWALGGTAAGKPVRVIVREGDGGQVIAARLARGHVVRSALVFRLVARMRGVGGDLKPGAYDFREGMGVSAVIDRLRTGVPLKVFRFTVPEGKTVVEIASIVGHKTPISRAAFLKAARSGEHRIPLLPKGSRDLEGLLFPKTYEIVERTTADDLVELLLQQFIKETAGLDFAAAARRLHLTPYQAVIVASLIEREARVDKDRPLVSSVIYNRLARPQRLQIDATIQYALLMRTGHYKNPLTFEDLKLDSRYNTYRIDGLPPTPIASPGLAALQAALAPAKTDFYYYRLKKDSAEHCFARDEAGFHRCASA